MKRKLTLARGGALTTLQVERQDDVLELVGEGGRMGCRTVAVAPDRGYLNVDGRIHPYYVLRQGQHVQVWLAGRVWHLEAIAPDAPQTAAAEGSGELRAPMPGTVLKVLAEAGASVQAGQTLVVMESMKMELSVAAPRDGRVALVPVAPGQLVDAGVVLVRLEEVAGESPAAR